MAAEDERSITIGGQGASLDALFPPHGVLDCRLDWPFVRFTAEGPFNWETLAEYARLMPPLYREAAQQGPYVSIVTVIRSAMMPPAAFAALADSVRQVHASGFGSSAVVYVLDASVEGRELVMNRMAKEVYGPSQVPFAWFDTVAEAEAWGRTVLLPGSQA